MDDRQCEHGEHGNRYTFCRHPDIARGKESVARSAAFCRQCPLFEPMTGKTRRLKTRVSTCIHLGEVTGDVPCKTCGGKVVATHKHACSLGGECIQRMRHVEWAKEQAASNGERLRIKCCETCQDRTTTPPAPATPRS